MNLYKYIRFEENNFWKGPFLENRLYFSDLNRLRSVNDQNEFQHNWDSTSYFFSTQGHELRRSYDALFNNTRILCMGKQLCRYCWQEFCGKSGGVCYKFRFRDDLAAADLTRRHVNYGHNLNAPTYLFARLPEGRLKNILYQTKKQTISEGLEILEWLRINNNFLVDTFSNHILEELVFKKQPRYLKEREYRFVHLIEPVNGTSLLTTLESSKLSFSQLGLTLERVFTSDEERVKSEFTSDEVKISKPSFL